jgi:transposase-like protein
MNHERWAEGFSVSDSPDPEVTPKAKRRSFSAPYKKKILAEVEAAAGTGSIGEILRREGIYSSTLTGWRREHDAAIDNRKRPSCALERSWHDAHSPGRPQCREFPESETAESSTRPSIPLPRS